ncbi:MAG: hypothetical protein ACO4AH_09945, partial [Burkholderiaceae bacterium]
DDHTEDAEWIESDGLNLDSSLSLEAQEIEMIRKALILHHGKRKKAAAVKRHLKRVRSMQLPKRMY